MMPFKVREEGVVHAICLPQLSVASSNLAPALRRQKATNLVHPPSSILGWEVVKLIAVAKTVPFRQVCFALATLKPRLKGLVATTVPFHMVCISSVCGTVRCLVPVRLRWSQRFVALSAAPVREDSSHSSDRRHRPERTPKCGFFGAGVGRGITGALHQGADEFQSASRRTRPRPAGPCIPRREGIRLRGNGAPLGEARRWRTRHRGGRWSSRGCSSRRSSW